MTVIAHLSDLHFGSEDPAAADALVAELNREALDLVILSGDLTLAARNSEFERARAFIDALEVPAITVPGNHDISPYAIAERLAAPYRRWRRHISEELEPSWFGGDVAVIGLNTARRARLGFDWSHGSLSLRQIRRLADRFAGLEDTTFRIVVAHHPFVEEAIEDLTNRPRVMVKRAQLALQAFAEQRVDLVTAGHLHRTYAAAFHTEPEASAVIAEAELPAHKVTIIQAGTALSSRTRGEVNSFNRIEVAATHLEVHPVTWVDTRWVRAREPLIALDRA